MRLECMVRLSYTLPVPNVNHLSASCGVKCKCLYIYCLTRGYGRRRKGASWGDGSSCTSGAASHRLSGLPECMYVAHDPGSVHASVTAGRSQIGGSLRL